MVNNVLVIGRLTRDPDVYDGKEGKKIVKMTVACDDGFGDNKKTNYIPVTVFGKTAEFIANYVGRGRLVCVEGKIQTGTYEKQDGTKVKTFDVIADRVNALDRAKEDGGKSASAPAGFHQVDTDIPF
jgi:single-strand DNA-binding protein